MEKEKERKDEEREEKNPLGSAPEGRLIAKFAIPAIISMLVSALYNLSLIHI